MAGEGRRSGRGITIMNREKNVKDEKRSGIVEEHNGRREENFVNNEKKRYHIFRCDTSFLSCAMLVLFMKQKRY